jgi:hypothetical protein
MRYLASSHPIYGGGDSGDVFIVVNGEVTSHVVFVGDGGGGEHGTLEFFCGHVHELIHADGVAHGFSVVGLDKFIVFEKYIDFIGFDVFIGVDFAELVFPH